MKFLLILCLAITLSGCVTAEEQASQDDKTCHSYGAANGTTAYFQCRMIKSQQHIQEDAQSQAIIQNGINIISESRKPPPTFIYAPAVPMAPPNLN
jgi:hypothetical protein